MTERELLQKAITCLICALAHDEAVVHGAPVRELADMRGHWVPDAEEIVDEAGQMGLLNYAGEDDD
jgi:hypothetical protein